MGEEFDEEGISLTGSGTKLTGDTERKDHVYGLGEDLEEDKRE